VHPFPLIPSAAVLLAAGALTACGGAETRAKDAAPVSASTPPVPRPMTPSDSACPRDGTWKACALEDRINKAGVPLRVLDTITVPYLATSGVRYKVGKIATMAVFYFPDSAAAVAATKGLDPLRLTPRGDTLGAWPAVPREVVRSANLVAVLFDVSATQAERLRLAITAGAPVTYPGMQIPAGEAPPATLPPMQSR
jgi:hypothetical protein